ncbi:MAG: PilZ domain-containing protein [Desulfuromonadales bacterium]|nr:PilZ domain-containing protein [Desulfuromonadales bacterium]
MITKELLIMLSKEARDKYRLGVPDNLYIETGFDDKKRLGRLVNLSCKGACIEFIEGGELPLSNTEITLQILLPQQSDPVSLVATVAWARKLTNNTNSRFVNLGVKFEKLDANTYDRIWGFIVDTISSPLF